MWVQIGGGWVVGLFCLFPPFLGAGRGEGGVSRLRDNGNTPIPSPKIGMDEGMLVPTQDPGGNGGARPKEGRTDGLFVLHVVNTLIGGTKLIFRVGERPKNLIAPQISARGFTLTNPLCGAAEDPEGLIALQEPPEGVKSRAE